MSRNRTSATVGATIVGGGAISVSVTEFSGASEVVGISAVSDGVSVSVRGASVGVRGASEAASAGLGTTILGYFGDIAAIVGTALLSFLGFLVDVVIGLLIGGGIVAILGLLLLAVISFTVEIGQRRAAQIPAHLRTNPSLAPRTLRWVHRLLPDNEGAAWLTEVVSCLAETPDTQERRRYIRSYLRSAPQLIWTSWMLHVRGSRSRKLS